MVIVKESKIMNIGIVAHVDAGKTTLTEQLLYRSGELRKKGNVDDGTAQTDWLPIERARGISVKASSASITKGDCRINLIDTPGHVDFAGEVERSLGILDGAVLILSAVEGIQAQTELLFEALKQTATPTVLLINKIDRAGSDVDQLIEAMKTRFSPAIINFHEVLRQGGRDCAIREKPFSDIAFVESCVLALSESDPALLERYFSEEGGIPPAELEDALKAALSGGQIFPVLCASAALGVGMDELLAFLIKYMEGSSN